MLTDRQTDKETPDGQVLTQGGWARLWLTQSSARALLAALSLSKKGDGVNVQIDRRRRQQCLLESHRAVRGIENLKLA